MRWQRYKYYLNGSDFLAIQSFGAATNIENPTLRIGVW